MNLAIDIFAQRERFGEEKAWAMARDAGFDYVNYDIAGIEDEPEFMHDPSAYARRIKGYMEKYRLKCNLVHAPYFMRFGQSFDESNKNYLEIVQAMEAASVIGAPVIVVHSITVPAEEKADFREYNLRFYKSLIPYCERFNIKVAVENLCMADEKRRTYKGKLGTPGEMREFIGALNSPWFTVCVDVGHAAVTGMEPEDYILGMGKGMVSAVHIHDTDYLADRHMLPYGADLNWSAIMKALRQIEYTGDLSFEIISFLRRIPDELLLDALKFSRRIGEHLISEFEA